MPESEGRPPVGLVLDERELLYEWLDRRFLGRCEVTVHSMRLEGRRHFDLVHVAGDHGANRSEGLKPFTIGICRPRRVHDDAVPSLQPPRGSLCSVIQLYEASLDPEVYVIPRGDTDPEAVRAGHGSHA